MSGTPRPHDNCYWVVPGVLMAGEHPYVPRTARPLANLDTIAAAGVRHFIDLTERHDGVTPYESVLTALPVAAVGAIGYERWAIPDRGIPQSPVYTNRILDRIDELVVGNRVPYVHCWGGVGRTGTIVGCWLVRHGKSGDEALAEIAMHWTTVEKRGWHPRSPETRAQVQYVLDWAGFDDGKA